MAETERLNTTSEIYLINGTDLGVDIYVNYEASASISDPASYTIGQTFVCDGTALRPFATYTFEVRLKGDPAGPILATASAPLLLGRSFTGVFHARPGGGHQLSIYENDLSVGTDARLTVRNNSTYDNISWTLTPNGTDPSIPQDAREGTIGNSNWQIARSIVPNTYDLQIRSGGTLVARIARFEVGLEQNMMVNICGTPRASLSPKKLRETLVIQELEYDVGPAVTDSTSGSRPALATTDTNARVSFECQPLGVWQSNAAEAVIRANDPDGWVNTLAVERVYPPMDGIQIDPDSFTGSPERGAAATGTLKVSSDVPPGRYKVMVTANRETMAETARCQVDLKVRPINVARLRDQLDRFRAAGDVDRDFAAVIQDQLDETAMHLSRGDLARACKSLSVTFERLNAAEGAEITQRAATPLIRETGLMMADIGCA